MLVISIGVYFLTLAKSKSQDIQISNETIYLSEVLTFTAPSKSGEFHFIGWLVNNTRLSINEHHSLNLGLMLTHGGEPSVNSVGDLQVFSNLEAGFLYGFNEVYYQYEKGDLWFKVGQVDINTDFAVTENGLLFTHSSFGIDPATTLNLPAPTYPVTAGSITAQIPISTNFKLRFGVFDGQFAMSKNDFLRIDWSLNKDEGMLYIVEPEFNLFRNKITQKIGFYHHSGLFLDRTYNGVVQNEAPTIRGLNTFYTISDLELKRWNENRKLSLFIQTAWSQRNVSIVSNYLGIGFRATNLFNTKKDNQLGLAVGHANVNSDDYNAGEWNNLANETVLELTYQHFIKDWLNVQPYFQLIHMAQRMNEDTTPTVYGIRFNWSF
ncbi:MAG: hypothetical protein DCO95_18370 [Roseivirga sp. XM-24bin3]|nr:MAG: hypothetical protein DCO95_18370 [Roseivirga sp. XM-24bin3]